MKKSKKILAIIAIVLVVITVVAVIAVASSSKARDIISAIVGGDEYSADNDLNNDGDVDILDVIQAVKEDSITGPKLTSLSLDDSDYSLAFSDTRLSYTLKLPAGRPRIPKVSATAAAGCDVTVEQATIADTENFGAARVTVSDASGKTVYMVKFERAEVEDTVVLQYDDRFNFTPDYTLKDGESFTFASEDTSVISVDNNGVLIAENVSDTPVKVKAYVGETEVDTLTVTKVDKAQVNLFLVTGQSNAQGCYDFNENSSLNITASDQIKAVERPEVSGRVYSFDVYPRSGDNPEAYAVKGTLYDMAEIPRQGFASALGKTYYNLSGEKVVFLQTAYSGAPIERWLDPAVHGSLAETNNNYYQGTQTGYASLMTILDENLYEINRRENFWLQGETCMGSIWDYDANTWKSPGAGETLFTDEDYTNMFLKVHNQMINDFGITSSHILLARAHGVANNADVNVKAYINSVRAAQYSLGNNYDDITVVSRLSDYAVIGYSKYIGTPYEPYMGYMGVGNVHYNQIGHNANGRIAATNFFKSIDVDTNSVANSVEIIDTNGIDRLNAETLFEIEIGDTKRLAAFALPEYSLENVAWSSSNEKVAKVNEYGLITVVGTGDAVITAISESGAKASVNVKGLEKAVKEVHYRWDFNGNLTSSLDKNDLRLSDRATANGAQNNYSYADGALVVSSSVADLNKPDFTMEFPVTVSSKTDWSIEWKARFYKDCIFLGQECCNTTLNTTQANKTRQINHLYSISSNSNFASTGNAYPLRFVDSTATDHWLSYGDYQSYNRGTRSTWKLEYKAQTGMISFYYSDNGAWVLVDSVEGGTFEATFDNVLGRYNEAGLVNFAGEMDYLEIKVSPATVYEDLHYRWDFNGDLTSSADANTLTMAEISANAGAVTTYDSTNNMIVVSGSIAQAKRPNYKMTTPVVLTRDFDWSVEWKSKLAGGSGILGQELDSADKNFMYAAYSTAPYNYALKIDDDNGGHVYLPYADNATDAANLNQDAMRCWKVTYVASTNTMSLMMSEDDGATWTTRSTYNPTSSEFTKVTYNTVFGRYNEAGLVNFRGTMDYLDIKTKAAVVKEYTVYDWQFNDYTSSEDKNTLTPTGTSGFSIENGIYKTTGRADELALEKEITLDSSESWHIEWCYAGTGSQSNSLFGTVDCGGGKTNHIYLAASTYTGDFASPVRILFSNGAKLDLQYVKGAENSTEPINMNKTWNIWRLEYDKTTRTISLKMLNSSKAWVVCDSAVMTNDFSMTFTRMFGDFNGSNMVNMYGEVDYVKVYFVDKSDN
ncbi:MAG: Ig-like domain-containing protein [Clostridia bacterium]|nr:Ig-like domain-containing protein [Clostridia bacterium]